MQKKTDFCPLCKLQKDIDNKLDYRPGSTISHVCSEGHEFDDRETLTNLMTQAFSRKPEPVILENRELDPEYVKAIESGAVITDATAPMSHGGKAMIIGPVDVTRLSTILGHFTDSSSLFGSVFSLNQQLAETKDLLQRAMDAKRVSKIPTGKTRKVGGDMVIELLIPERHVQPLIDLAGANGMDLERYMNARTEDALDNQWFY
jgi:hypothetical protein